MLVVISYFLTIEDRAALVLGLLIKSLFAYFFPTTLSFEVL